MKFSENTLAVLKNFSEINPSVMFRAGNTIRTISPQRTVMAAATVADEFPGSAGVYDLTRFLGMLSLSKNPEISFEDKKFAISSDRIKTSYGFASESMIVTAPDKDIVVPDPECTIDVEWADISNVLRAASVLQLGEISFMSDGSHIYMSALNTKNPTSDNCSVKLAESTDGKKYNMVIKVENLRLMPMDYTITLSSAGMAHFKSENIQYWIALQSV